MLKNNKRTVSIKISNCLFYYNIIIIIKQNIADRKLLCLLNKAESCKEYKGK